MPTKQQYEQAKQRIASDPQRFFPDGEQRDDGWWWRRRPERTPSCHIVGDSYAVHDFGDDTFKGSVLDAYAEQQSIPVEDAVARIADEGGEQPKRRERKKRERPRPQIPIPDAALKNLNTAARAEWVTKRHGQPVKGWTYRDAKGRPLFCVIRYESEKGKAILPWYYGEDDQWQQAQAHATGRPLYGLDRLAKNPDSPVLVVEGEKCADIEIPGYVVITWPSGSAAVTKADWSPLSGRDVLVWPDADEPGQKAARAIAQRLPGTRILQIPTDKPKGWDLADAATDGTDIPTFIATNTPTSPEPDSRPFIPLGYDASDHWFLLGERRLPFRISCGQFSASKLGELAPLSWWGQVGYISDQGAIKTSIAQDYVVGKSAEAGPFVLDRLRGVGVWMDRGRIVINDGRQIVLPDGSRIGYCKFDGEAYYTSSADVSFPDMSGSTSDDEEGRALARLFGLQQFASRLQGVCALGWSLISPFGGLLAWRPNLWITGRKGVGKTWLLNLMREIVGSFAHRGTGGDTQAGIRRSLNLEARPVILDETETRTKRERENIGSILTLIRNSAGEGSGYITMAQGDGVRRYLIRSCFCIASVNIQETDAAQSSRFVICELKHVPESERDKIEKSAQLRTELLGRDSARFRRRIFRALPQILRDIEYLRDGLGSLLHDQRRADLYAPLLAAAWAVQSADSLDSEAGRVWQAGILDDIFRSAESEVAEDEDRVIEQLLSAIVRMDGNQNRTVAELLQAAFVPDGSDTHFRAKDHLSRHGMELREIDGRTVLAVARRADQIKRLLADTPYAADYDAPLRRNALCLNPEDPRQITMAIGRPRCRLLDWSGFRARYMEEVGE